MENYKLNRESSIPVSRSVEKRKIEYLSLYGLALTLAIHFNPITSYALEVESFGGWEGDSQDQGFGFASLGSVFVINDRTALLGRVMGSYLYYNFDSVNSTTKVTSPGVTLLSGSRFS